MKRFLVSIILMLTMSGCALLGRDNSMVFDCQQLGQYSRAYSGVPVVDDIVNDGPSLALDQEGAARFAASPIGDDDPLVLALGKRLSIARSLGTVAPKPAILLLSGGGQWGAYGAGFINQLAKTGRFAKPGIVTGVSTGSIQSLFIAAGQYQRMRNLYNDTEQVGLVNNGGYLSILTRGSVSTYEPLRSKLLKELCADDTCQMLRDIANGPDLFIGIVEGNSGKFIVVNVGDLVRQATADSSHNATALRSAAQCVTAVALASSAVPVFDQRIKIRSNEDGQPVEHVYLDGGVRHSVFEAYVAGAAKSADKANAVDLYVMRNGPTQVVPFPQIDRKADPLTAALRGYAIIVNEGEVMSIAALRLSRPTGDIFFTTANGYASSGQCVKQRPNAPFEHQFMQCLVAYGERRAGDSGAGWRALGHLAIEPTTQPLQNEPTKQK